MIPAAGTDETELLRLAGALEDASEHPIAAAIAAGARERVGVLPAVESFASTQGLGVHGVVDGHAVAAGRVSWLAHGMGAAAGRPTWTMPAGPRNRPAGRSSRSAGTAPPGACWSSPTR